MTTAILEKPLPLAHNEFSVSFRRKGYNIVLPVAGSIEDGYHESIALDLNRVLDKIDEIFGEEYATPVFLSEKMYRRSSVLYRDQNFLDWSDTYNSKRNMSFGSTGFRLNKVRGKIYRLFEVDYRDTYFYISALHPILRDFLGEESELPSDTTYFTVDEVLTHLQAIQESIANTFLLSGQELTSVKQHRFISLLFETELFENPIVKQIIGLTPNTPVEKDPKLALLASKGYDATLLKVFYVYKYFPSYGELEEWKTLPFDWVVNILGGKR